MIKLQFWYNVFQTIKEINVEVREEKKSIKRNLTKMGSRETKSEAKGVRMGGEMDGGRGIGN